MSMFEKVLEVSNEDVEFYFRGIEDIPWEDFLLNPRRLRGSDFLMRWSQGSWSEKRLIEAVNNTKDYFAIEYGPSGVAPENDVRAFELYFERLEKAGLGNIKRPDLLVFNKKDLDCIEKAVEKLGGKEELPFTPEPGLSNIIEKSIIAVECENSLWKSISMPDYHSELKPMKRLGGKPGLKKNAVLPTIIIKDEDIKPLLSWQDANNKKIHIWHVFFDKAFGISFDRALELFESGVIEPNHYNYQSAGGSTQRKTIYKIYYHYAYKVGEATEEPKLLPAFIEDKNGHILPYVTFEGGSITLDNDAVDLLQSLESK